MQMNWDVQSPFVFGVTPMASDIDGLNHVNNAVYVRWCEQAAWAHIEHLGLSHAEYLAFDRAMTIRRAEYDYIQPALLGDVLTLATWLGASGGKTTMVRNFQMIRERDGQTLMRGRWELVCIEISTGRVKRMPPRLGEMYQAALIG